MHLWWEEIKSCLTAERERWGLWLPVLFGAGIGIYFLLPGEPPLWITLILIEGTILLAVVWRFRPPLLVGLLAFGMMLAGFADIQLRSRYLAGKQAPVPPEKMYIQARIAATDYNYRGNRRLTLDNLHDFDGKAVPGRFRVSLREKNPELQSGQCVELVAKLFPLARAVLPGGYQFDRKSFYLGLSGSGYAVSRVLPIECRQPVSITDKISFETDALRQSVIRHINNVLPPEEAAVTAAIMAGEQGGIPQKILEDYRRSGLAHFLSISGLHMSLIAGLMFFFIRLLIALVPPLALRWNSKKISAVFAIFISTVYLLISGAAVPAQRAFIMTLIVLTGVLTDRRAISMKTIAWAAFIVLLISPEALIGASFQMSFAAVIALIAFYEKLALPLQRFLNGGQEGKTAWWRRLWRILFAYAAGILISDLIASLATLPFQIYHFNNISVYTSLANLASGPIIGFLIMPFTLLGLLLMPFGADVWCLRLVGLGISWVNDITAWVSALPGAYQPVLSMPWWGLILIVLGGLWLAIWERKWRFFGFAGIFAGFLSIAAAAKPDALINGEADLFAVRAQTGQMIVLPARGNNFIKEVWRGKTASAQLDKIQKKRLSGIWNRKKRYPEWLDLHCDEKACLYKGRLKLFKAGGAELDGKRLPAVEGEGLAVFMDGAQTDWVTVRDDIGHRFWNR